MPMTEYSSPRASEPVTPENTEQLEVSRSPGITRHPAFVAFLGALFVFVVTSFADLVMLYEHQPARLTIEISDAISAVIIGVLGYQLLRLQRQRREHLRRRLETIADMNHHVRNALQVIAFSTHQKSQEEIAAIKDSVNRIQWALRELLPKI
jgi:hypothetical protein